MSIVLRIMSMISLIFLIQYSLAEPQTKMDIVFVFDTTNSMDNAIGSMKDYSKDYADSLRARGIDYRLGLTEFKDYPPKGSCTECGYPGDFPYKVYNSGVLTSYPATFKSWIDGLSATGGHDKAEAILAALRHTATDQLWRSDANKIAILITDTFPHSDGDCCNYGDTQDNVISALKNKGVTVYVVGKEESTKVFASTTGGEFYNLGDSLQPILDKISSAAQSRARGPQLPLKEIVGVLSAIIVYMYIIKPIFARWKGKKVTGHASNNSVASIQFLPRTDLGNQTIESDGAIVASVRRGS
jgi:hypothetical protein